MQILPKPYFLAGDVLAVAISSALAAVAVFLITPESWPMVPAMLLGMIIGMLISMVMLLLVFTRYFGAMEVMVPSMLGAMLAGMWVSMSFSMQHIVDNTMHAAKIGLLIGIASLCVCYLLNAYEQLRLKKAIK